MAEHTHPASATAPKGRASSGDPLEALGVRPAAVQILRYFLVRPDAQPHGRELRRVLRLSGASVDRELGRLVTLHCLELLRDGNRVRYAAVPSSRVWAAARLLAGDPSDPVPLLENALAGVPGVEVAFVFGSWRAARKVRTATSMCSSSRTRRWIGRSCCAS